MWWCFIVIVLGAWGNCAGVENATDRTPRFWGGWGVGIVRFENKYCTTPEGLDGTCYTRRQCRDLDGAMSGRCAGSIGFCCIIQRGCGATSSYNNTYFVNRNYPATIAGSSSCTFVIQKCNSEICQARIDFLSSTLASPDANGTCIYDSMQITGGASLVRPICGENSGKHIYLGFNGDDDITITIITSASYVLARSWYLKVAQIECGSPNKAPDGCLMYYTSLNGAVSSFNYGRTTSGEYNLLSVPNITVPGTRELANLNYGICVNMAPGYCSIEWSASSTGSFAVTNSTPGMVAATTGCYTDYVLIPSPTVSQSPVTPDRFCGNTFPASTRSFSKPFVLYVVTDGTEIYSNDLPADMNPNDFGNLGFSLNYRQQPCNPLLISG